MGVTIRWGAGNAEKGNEQLVFEVQHYQPKKLMMSQVDPETFYHHAFVAEGVDQDDPNDTVYFVAQFFEGVKIPKCYNSIGPKDFQV